MREHPGPDERKSAGKARRHDVPRSSHGDWSPAVDRPDPVEVITAQDASRVQALVPIRHGRMAESPFAFFRGAAKVMAGDLAATPSTGFDTQLCGDAHLANFGSYASPDRRQVFDVNDFDETLRGPWEWDLKRLATSFVLAGRDNGFDRDAIQSATTRSVSSYREAMATFGSKGFLDVWYSQAELADIAASAPKKKVRKRIARQAKKERSKGSLKAFAKLTESVDGATRIKSDPPLLLRLDETPGIDPDEMREQVSASHAAYRDSLPDDRRVLLDRYEMIDVAFKVVGVGSVGTRCMIMLFEGRDEGDPLFLQIKEAAQSVLADHLTASPYNQPGRRVVEGQRLMQASSDIFLGWASTGVGHHDYYWRQFHDMKGSADVAAMGVREFTRYANICGTTLAHAHARSGDAIAISGYMGSGHVFDRALTNFAHTYADLNDQDYEAFRAAIDSGRIDTAEG